MVVDGDAHVVLLAESRKVLAPRAAVEAHLLLLAVDLHLLLLGRHRHDRLHADGRRVVERLLRLLVRSHVDRPHAVARDAVVLALLLELGDLRRRGVERQVEVLDAEVVDIQRLHEVKRAVRVELVEREAGDAELERHLLAGGLARAAARTARRLAAGGEQRKRARAKERTTIHHGNNLLVG